MKVHSIVKVGVSRDERRGTLALELRQSCLAGEVSESIGRVMSIGIDPQNQKSGEF